MFETIPKMILLSKVCNGLIKICFAHKHQRKIWKYEWNFFSVLCLGTFLSRIRILDNSIPESLNCHQQMTQSTIIESRRNCFNDWLSKWINVYFKVALFLYTIYTFHGINCKCWICMFVLHSKHSKQSIWQLDGVDIVNN